MAIRSLGRKSKQPGDTADFYVLYEDWFAGDPPGTPARTDAPLSYAVSVPAGLTLVSSSISGTTIKVVVSGGTSGRSYKITVTLTTDANPSIIKEGDFTVEVLAV